MDAYVFNTEVKNLYKINTQTGEKQQLNKAPIENIRPDQIEYLANGILLSSAQHMTLVGYDGNII